MISDRTKTGPTPRRRDVITAKRRAVHAWQRSNHPGARKLRSIWPVGL